MAESVFEKLEESYPKLIGMIPNDIFNSLEFMPVLLREHQEPYIQALLEQNQSDQPSLAVAALIAEGLKRRTDLVTYLGKESIAHVFEQAHDFEIWQKVKA